jgi:predicted DNA-binding protein
MGETHGMRVQSVRFSEDQWTRLQVESRRQGVSASQYIREAAIARYWLDIARNERPELAQVEEFLDAAKALERDHED